MKETNTGLLTRQWAFRSPGQPSTSCITWVGGGIHDIVVEWTNNECLLLESHPPSSETLYLLWGWPSRKKTGLPLLQALPGWIKATSLSAGSRSLCDRPGEICQRKTALEKPGSLMDTALSEPRLRCLPTAWGLSHDQGRQSGDTGNVRNLN